MKSGQESGDIYTMEPNKPINPINKALENKTSHKHSAHYKHQKRNLMVTTSNPIFVGKFSLDP